MRSVKIFTCIFFLTTVFSFTTAAAQERTDPWLELLLRKQASPLLQRVLDHPDSFQYQVIYTQITRDKNNVPHFQDHYLHVDKDRYFYPASTVKLPVALLALEKLNSGSMPGVNKHTAMLTDSAFSGQTKAWSDSTAANGLPSIAHYIRKIFIVSDNDAYNRLYEFMGQQAIHERLWKKGYTEARITHRFVRLTPEENRHSNPVRFTDGSRLVFYQPEAYNNVQIDTSKRIFLGQGYLDKDERLVTAPMDFSKKNRFPLKDLQQVLQSVLFPESVPDKQRFILSTDDEQLLLRALSEYPAESKFPRYDTTEFFDSYAKFFFRDGKAKVPSSIRIFNKAGWSYGFLTDVAYIVDFGRGVEFMLSGVIYVNSDGILNDDQYDYETIGWPFFREVGKVIYEFELKRRRKYKPDLSRFKLDYTK